MSGAPQRQQLASERTPLTSFAPAPSTGFLRPADAELVSGGVQPSLGGKILFY
ncbi:MAG: hypothetical protein PUE06_08605 [Bacteroidales bacterium]|nr:hypothetical protein [Bacteroidales bacterium]